ncbi:MAG: hypothetical protein KDI63_08490 [Gammaproteobacteria bacterium]|nr:hypothetical protein [Gammaproteobacteria bacterium]
MNLPRLLPLAVIAVSISWAALADRLLIDVIENSPANTSDGIPRPLRGQHMEQVRQHYGEPVRRLAPVGDPPITRWDYDRYTVYFENQTVLRSVVKQSPR